MASTWDPTSDPTIVERDSLVRSTLVNHLLTISKMNGAIDVLPDTKVLKHQIVSSLSALGVPQDFLTQLSGQVEHDKAMIEALDVTPVVSFVLLRAARTLIDQKKFETAQELIAPFVDRFPEHSEAHYLLARAEVGLWHFDIAETLYERAIALDTRRLESYSGLATLYERTKEYKKADKTWRRAFEFGAIFKRPFLGKGEPQIRVLVITSVLSGNIRFMRFLNTREFQITSIIAESYTPDLFLPEHDVVFQAIGDVELCVRAVEIAREIAARSNKPLINDPSCIVHTSREENSVRFRELENVVTPLTVTFDRNQLVVEDAERFLLDQGFVYPMLMRSPGYFNGSFFEKVDSKEDIARVVGELPGDDIIVIQYIDTTRADGTIRKYRVMGIDKKLYPLHLAISYNWKIHYFSANMRDKQEFRDEEYAFLYDTENVLGPKVMTALHGIVETLGLEYCGIDFTVNDAGEVVVFEANATMALLLPDNSPEWNYRREPIQNALKAAKDLIYARVSQGEKAVKLVASVAKNKLGKAELTRKKKRSERKASKKTRGR